ncbi:Uncharacterised protein [uncultured Clostridium sp.]|nr:Uncharacterised protein [uncultured Clostridium sp.]SCI89815.1 Uncharacterised protein [uncultured Clostridium sp.]
MIIKLTLANIRFVLDFKQKVGDNLSSSNEYYKEYRRAERDCKSGKREDLIDERSVIEFKSKKITVTQFKKYYKDRLKSKEQELIFGNCLDLLTLIENNKQILEIEGTYIKNATGTLKVNPAKKELREDLKAFTTMLTILNATASVDEDESLEDWLNG